MPFYEYQCKNCGHDLEAMQKITEAPLKKCPHCGKSQLQRLMSAPVFRLKGGGWYETDFKGDQDTKRNLADRPEADAKARRRMPKRRPRMGSPRVGTARTPRLPKQAPRRPPPKDKPADKPAAAPESGPPEEGCCGRPRTPRVRRGGEAPRAANPLRDDPSKSRRPGRKAGADPHRRACPRRPQALASRAFLQGVTHMRTIIAGRSTSR